jgi:MFS family permease
MSFFGVSHTVLIPAFAEDVLGSRDHFALLVAATGMGAMAGALSAGQSKKPPALSRGAVGLVAYGIVLAVFASTRSLAVALTAQVAVGYFYFSVMTGLQTLIQQIVDESKRGRVMSLFQVAWAGLVPFGSLAMGYLAGPLGTPSTLLASASICSLFGVGMAIYARGLPLPQRAH